VLNKAFDKTHQHIGFGPFPYVPGVMQAPYYYFIGKKNSSECPI